jgi:hypothetical protein
MNPSYVLIHGTFHLACRFIFSNNLDLGSCHILARQETLNSYKGDVAATFVLCRLDRPAGWTGLSVDKDILDLTANKLCKTYISHRSCTCSRCPASRS